MPKIPTEQLWWGNKINQFERNQINSSLKQLLFEAPLEKLPIWYCEVLKMVLFACSYAYREAYGWDNLTAKMYEDLALKLPKIDDAKDPNEFAQQKEKLDEFVAFFPGEFQEAVVIGGLFQTGEGEPLTKQDFENLWKFMESEPFDKFTIKAIHEQGRI